MAGESVSPTIIDDSIGIAILSVHLNAHAIPPLLAPLVRSREC